jgi:outer membrane beta-barrel protein
MNQFRLLVLTTALVTGLSFTARAEDTPAATTQKSSESLENQLKSLDATNQAPASVSTEKLYSVQSRYTPLRHVSEITFGGAKNMTGDSFLDTNQIEVGYRFHFNDRWAVGLSYAWVDNEFKSDADNLKATSGAIPDVPYAITRQDLLVEYNAFYGKFRWTADSVSYFDQYWALGPGMVQMNTGNSTAAVADAGFAIWMGQWGSARLGLKDYYYSEQYRSGATMTSNLHAHLDVGYLF